MSVEAIFQQTVERHRMFLAGQRVLVAVSGGPDSTALLHLLAGLRRRMPLHLRLAHLDHGLRGDDSAADRRFVEAMGRDLELPVTCRVLPGGGARSEAGARKARYRFLEEAAEEMDAQRIATGHTRDDQAETVLLNLLRGAGCRGLAGIPPVRGPFVRPLLEVPRRAVEAWLRDRGIPWREDRSNRDRGFTRNRVRLDLIPLLEREFRPGLRRRLAATAGLLRDDDDLLDELARGHYHRLVLPSPEGVSLDAEGVASLAPALARRVLRRAYRCTRRGDHGPGVRAVEALRAMLAAGAAGPVDLPGSLQGELRDGRLSLRRRRNHRTLDPFQAAGQVPGRLAWPDAGIFLKMQEVDRSLLCGDIRHESREIAYLDLDRTGRRLVLRNRRPGDAFHPLGLGGRKKIQDFLVDAGVPRRDRDRVGLLTTAGEVAWLVGLRLDDRFKVTAATRNVLVVRQERE